MNEKSIEQQEHEQHKATPNTVVVCMGNMQGNVTFTVTVTSPEYSPEQVSDQLLSGDLNMYLGDTELYDETEPM